MKKICTIAAVISVACLGSLCASGQEASAAGHAAQVLSGLTPGEALTRLLEGNQRFVKGEALHPGGTPARRAELVAGQKPFATVLTCSDSRVPPELLFDQGLGDIFVVRVAGNVAGTSEQGSIEYAAEHLGVPVLMVLGHTGCGAVKAASSGAKAEGSLAAVLKDLEPAVRSARAHGAKGEALAPAVVEENVRLTALNLLRKNKVVRGLAAQGKLKVSAAVYDLASGEVRLLDLEKNLKEERQARVSALRGLLVKFKDGGLDDIERARFLAGLTELLPELN